MPLFFLLLSLDSSAANLSVLHHSFGGGGGRAQSGSYSVQAATAGFGDVTSHTPSGLSNVAGFPGQITEEPTALNASYPVALNGSVSITLTASDPDNDPITFQVASNPAHGTLTGAAPNLTYQAGATFVTFDQFTFVVHDGTFQSQPATITLVAPGANAPPSIPPLSHQSVTEGQWLSVQVVASDPDQPGQSLTFALAPGSPPGAAIDPVSGLLTWTPTEAQGPGLYDITVIVTDNAPAPLQASAQFQVTVAEANQSPVLAAIADLSVPLGTLVRLTATATDSDLPAQLLQFRLGPGAPAGAQIDPVSGVFTWTPGAAAVGGQFPITILVSDNGAPVLSAARTFTVTVTGTPPPPANTAPLVALVFDPTIDVNAPFSLVVTASDADRPAQQLRFTLGPGAPDGAQIHPTTGLFTWTPGSAAAGQSFPVTVIVTDDGVPALSSSRSFAITVTGTPPPPPVNLPPVLAPIGNRLAARGQTITFTASATDPDLPPQRLTFALGSGAPAAARIDPATGLFSWPIPAAQALGDLSITVTVTDDGSPPRSASQVFQVRITTPNTPPVLSPLSDRQVNEGVTLTLPVLAVDSDLPAQKLVFQLDPGAPPGAAFDPAAFTFSWTPTELQGPGVYPITLRVTDDGDPPLSATASFAITVREVNTPPVLVPAPELSVRAGQRLVYAFSATDPDLPAQLLSFSLLDAPPGAALDTRTGLFAWTPPASHPGGLVVVQVAVSDNAAIPGTATQSLRIQVLPALPGSDLTLGLALKGKDQIELTLAGAPGACFRVEFTADFRDWTVLVSGAADANGRFTFLDKIAPGASGRWYRARHADCSTPIPPQWLGGFDLSGGLARFRFRGSPSSCYAIESTANFISWRTLTVLKADSAGHASFDTPVASSGSIFFRLREAACP